MRVTQVINLVGGYFFTVHLSSYKRTSLCKCKCKCNNNIYILFVLDFVMPTLFFWSVSCMDSLISYHVIAISNTMCITRALLGLLLELLTKWNNLRISTMKPYPNVVVMPTWLFHILLYNGVICKLAQLWETI